jgi:hypothetical protein
MGMKNLFLVTSAINSRFGVFNPEKRLEDTLLTIQSVKERAPEQPIIVLEMCGDELSTDQRDILKEQVTGLVEFGAMPDVKEIYKIDNWDIVKNMTEMLCCGRFFQHMQVNDLFPEVERVFKVSGRYTLNSDFDVNKFGPSGFFFAQKRQSQFPATVTGNDPNDNFQYMSRLWTFPRDRLAWVVNGYANMLTEMVTRCNEGGYLDIEHLLYRTFKNEKTNETTEREKMGIEGAIAPNGQQVRD